MGDTKWQMKCKTLADRNAHLLDSGLLTDCTFQVGSRVFQAHRVILAASSPVFEAMFYGGMATKEPIQIKDVEPEIFRDLLRYIYTDKVDVRTVNSVYQIYAMADKYMLPELMELCIQYIHTHLNTSNVCKAYGFAKFHDKLELKDKCLRLIKRQCESVLSDDSFNEVDIDTVLDILDLPDLNISNEIKLFEAIEKYYNNQMEMEQEPLQSDSTTNPVQSTIYKAMQKLRFLTLSPELFVDRVSESGLLTDVDTLGLIKNIVSSNCKTPAPNGFSTSRELRKHESPISENDTSHCSIRVRDEKSKLKAVSQICSHYGGVLILCDTHDKMERVWARISGNSKHSTYTMYEDLNTDKKHKMLQQYNNGNHMIAPFEMAKSIDMSEIYAVVNYDIPTDIDYVETVARKSWNGQKPLTINLVSSRRKDNVKNIEEYYSINLCQIQLNDDILSPIDNHRKT